MRFELINPIPPIRDFIALGGPVVAVLLLLSVVSFAIVFFKIWMFARLGTGANNSVRQAVLDWSSGHQKAALLAVSKDRTLLGLLVTQAMQAIQSLPPGRRNMDLEDRLRVEANAQLRQLESGFRALDSIAQIAPLIGLFGTVLGMIEAFQALQQAGNSVDPALLAGGIWVALLTTAVGLAVAMPTALCLSAFESRVARHRLAVEQALTPVLNPVRLSQRPPPEGTEYKASLDAHAH